MHEPTLPEPPGREGSGNADQTDLAVLASELDALPRTVPTADPEVLARPEVIHARRRARRLRERLEKPFYVNTDACWRYGIASLAYESAALGNRTEMMVCDRSVEAEYLAMIMAMSDAERALEHATVFRTDSATVTNRNAGNSPLSAECSERVNALLESHPNWWIVRVARENNRVAHSFACGGFDEMGQLGREFAKARYLEREDARGR